MVMLAAPVEPHAHLDKALSGLRAPNPAGDLAGAIEAWHGYWPQLTQEDIVARATAAVEAMVAARDDRHPQPRRRGRAPRPDGGAGHAGGARLRGGPGPGRPPAGRPGVGPAERIARGAEHRRLLDEALALGVDAVGGAPYRDTDPEDATRLALDAAARFGLPVDLHTDETTRPHRSSTSATWLAWPPTGGLGGTVTASHCVSLGVQEAPVQAARWRRSWRRRASAVVALPQTNLYLQGRDQPVAPPRGLTAVRPCSTPGVTVAAGADNVRDPFCPWAGWMP